MNKVTCYYFASENGRQPAKEFIDSLNARTQAKFSFAKGLLEEFGHKLPQPHAKYIGGNIFELRFSGMEGAVRVLYFFFHQDMRTEACCHSIWGLVYQKQIYRVF